MLKKQEIDRRQQLCGASPIAELRTTVAHRVLLESQKPIKRVRVPATAEGLFRDPCYWFTMEKGVKYVFPQIREMVAGDVITMKFAKINKECQTFASDRTLLNISHLYRKVH